jgi:hypothetical protein
LIRTRYEDRKLLENITLLLDGKRLVWVWLWYYQWYYFIKKIMQKEKTIKYNPKSIKMHEDTWKLLKLEREKSGLSWNVFLLKLLGKEKVYAKQK